MRRAAALLPLLVALACTRVGAPPPPPPPADLPPPGVDRERPIEPTGTEGASPAATPPTDPLVEELFRRSALRAPLPPALPPETGDVRALWIVRTALLHPDSARAAVRRADEAGFNHLLVQVRGRGDAYYRSSYEPPPDAMAPALRGSYDPLQVVLDEARARGLRVHAWLNLKLVASAALPPADPRHLLHRFPEQLAVPRALAPRLYFMEPRDPRYVEALIEWTRGAGDQVEGLYVNPAHPEVRMHLTALVRDLVERYPLLDGVHLDYIRYPSPAFDYSRTSLEAFRGWMRGEPGRLPDRIPSPRASADALLRADASWATDPFAYVAAFPEAWDAFRRGQITATMESIYWTVKEHRPGMLVSAAVFANADDARRGRFQEWEEWLRTGVLEVAVPMAYSPRDEAVSAQLSRAAAAAGASRVWLGLGIYQDTFGGAVGKALHARGTGAGGVALFSYDWAVGPDGTRAAGGSYLTRFAREVWGGG